MRSLAVRYMLFLIPYLHTYTNIIVKPQITTLLIHIAIPSQEIICRDSLGSLDGVACITRHNLVILLARAYRTRHQRRFLCRRGCGGDRRLGIARARYAHTNIIPSPEVGALVVDIAIPGEELIGLDALGLLDVVAVIARGNFVVPVAVTHDAGHLG